MTSRRLGAVVWLLIVLSALRAVLIDAAAQDRQTRGSPDTRASLTGQFLVAAPDLGDPRFAQSVILIVSHGPDGAMGLVVNRQYGAGSLRSLLRGFGVERSDVEEAVLLHYGGPVEQDRGFVLHSADYIGPSTRVVSPGLALSTGFDILKAIAAGRGPRHSAFYLGYAGWGAGQLEGELARHEWLTASAEVDMIFEKDLAHIWQQVLKRAGISL
jgi:putative transcriptional regulator